jgi:hypothetical protein
MKRLILILAVAAVLIVNSSIFAQPPPLGPPAPRAPINDMGVQAILTAMVRGKINETLTATNDMAAKNPDVHVKVSLSKFNVFAPGMSATQYTDRPNERYVRIAYMTQYRIYDIEKHTSVGWVGVPVERHISQSIELRTFCDRWQTGQGNLKIAAVIDAPYLENDQGTLEQVVNFFVANTLTSYIDNKVRQQLGSIPTQTVTQNLPGQCNALGAYAGNLSDPSDDTVQWSYHPGLKVNPATIGVTPFNQVSINLLTLKRLVAHDRSNAPLYKAVETPALEFYANFQHYFAQLPSIQENQQIALSAPAFSMPRPADSDPLVLIANIIQNGAVGTQPTDSAFVVYGRNNNFGNGTQTIRIRKSYWLPPSQMTGNKPTKISVDAYELTVKINAALPTLTQGSSSPGTIGPGTVATGGKVPAVNVAPLKEISKTPTAPASPTKTLTAPTTGSASR